MSSGLDNTLTIRLSLLEERILEMKRILSSPGYQGHFYALIRDLSSQDRQEIEALLDKVLQHLALIKSRIPTPPREERISHILTGMASTTLVSCLEMDPKRRAGYGGDSPHYRSLWEEEMEPIRVLLQILAQKAEKTRK